MMSSNGSFIDPFGVAYTRVSVSGNGFCGYNALAYSITGNEACFEDIINDCLIVFFNYEDIFRRHTEFGCNSNNSVDDYESQMRIAISEVNIGKVLLEEGYRKFWCEDAHIIALSLLYDIAVFVFDSRASRWIVYNHEGSRGYFCLLSDYAAGHFEPLVGKIFAPLPGLTIPLPPLIPRAAAREGYTRKMLKWNNEACNILSNKPYTFTNVYHWPRGIPEVNLINEGIMDDTLGESTCSNYNAVLSTGEPSFCNETFAAVASRIPKSIKTSFVCDFVGCNYVCLSLKSLNMHKRKHGKSEKNAPIASGEPSSVVNSPSDAKYSLTSKDVLSNVTRPRTDMKISLKKQLCKACNKFFVNLSNHKKCSRKMSIGGTEHAQSNRQNSPINFENESLKLRLNPDVDVNASIISQNYYSLLDVEDVCQSIPVADLGKVKTVASSSLKKVQCPQCKKFFTNLAAHKKCRKEQKMFSICSAINSSDSDSNPTNCVKIAPRRSQRLQSTSSNNTDTETESISSKVTLSKSEYTQVLNNTDQFKLPHRVPHRKKFSRKKGAIHNKCASKAAKISESINVNIFCNNLPASKDQDVLEENCSRSSKLKEILKKMSKPVKNQSDPLRIKLEKYHDEQITKIENIVTEKLSSEVIEVIANILQVDNEKRKFVWSLEDKYRLKTITSESKKMRLPDDWTWRDDKNYERAKLNHERMEYLVKNQCVFDVIQCSQCGSTGILVDEQIKNCKTLCYDCYSNHHNIMKDRQQKFADAWNKVIKLMFPQ